MQRLTVPVLAKSPAALLPRQDVSSCDARVDSLATPLRLPHARVLLSSAGLQLCPAGGF
ncbi:hypothetical protein DPV78_009832 [Talaromyces pinophilus]|nr:hypothetical protein DPV78_009832 [Talaromyces pinophilus]